MNCSRVCTLLVYLLISLYSSLLIFDHFMSASSPASSAAAAAVSSPMRALVFGASGATGREVVREFAQNPHCEYVTAVVRKSLPNSHFGLTDGSAAAAKLRQLTVDLEKPLEGSATATFGNHTVAVGCLGTTLAKAGSVEAFRQVDYTLTVSTADAAKKSGIPHFILLTSAGSNANSWFRYPKAKGEAERDIGQLTFPYYSIFRPSILLTKNNSRDDGHRTGESTAQKLFIHLDFMIPKSAKGVKVEQVAKAIVLEAQTIQAKRHKGDEKEKKEEKTENLYAKIWENAEILAS